MKQATMGTQKKLENLIHTAIQVHQKGNLEQAQNLYQKILKDNKNILVMNNLAVILQSKDACKNTKVNAYLFYQLGSLDLPWDDNCLSFHKTNRPISTASNWQVRQKINTSGLNRSKPYKHHLTILNEVINHHE